jgi:hypothetical protein
MNWNRSERRYRSTFFIIQVVLPSTFVSVRVGMPAV